MTGLDYFAHSGRDDPADGWQRLSDHLLAVAARAASFADAFGARDWGYAAGLWHDLGKYSEAFQTYLRSAATADSHIGETAGRVDHSTAGAQHAVDFLRLPGHLLAYVIAGHHSGLLNGRGRPSLEDRLNKHVEPWEHGLREIDQPAEPVLPPFIRSCLRRQNPKRDAFSVSFFVRMLLSCLADADFLDTEEAMDPARSAARARAPDDVLARMEKRLSDHLAAFGPPRTEVNRRRDEVRRACLSAAPLPPGLFSLTVPTGGGKTLSSLAFALRHALKHGLRRVVYVIPFTSIIEQNADVFRRVFAELAGDLGFDPVIEHHSNLDPERESVASRLATENWDAPLVVTTSVQLYESLFARRTSRCRKLHNLSRSVIILDEAQTIPVDYLEPCLLAIDELQTNYGASIVLCTATQPAVHRRTDFEIGLDGVREIIPDPQRLATGLKRVDVEDIGRQDDHALAQRITSHHQVLTIVNTRSHARVLYDLLGDAPSHIHLSALMCPAHRAAQLEAVKQRLVDDGECRVVSTQLVEAGVDLDFPVVYRSLAGVDSIAQAAGRCNREGRLEHGRGRTFVFRSEHRCSERFFADTAGCGAQVLELYDDPLTLEAVEHYFRLYYWEQSDRWDRRQILRELSLDNDPSLPFRFNFENVANAFKIIDNIHRPVIVPWDDEGKALCTELRSARDQPRRALLRKLQRYTVAIPPRLWNRHTELGDIELVADQYPVLVYPEAHYHPAFGLDLEARGPTLIDI